MYLLYFLLSFFLSILATFFVAIFMRRWGVVDKVAQKTRKIHKRSIALGGGLAIFVAFFVVTGIVFLSEEQFFRVDVVWRNIMGIFFGACILFIGGFIDDKYVLRPRYQIVFPLLAVLCVIGFGIGPHEISNPFGGIIDLTKWRISLGFFGTFVVLADVLVFLWLMGMMFTTKFLDGLDGLVSGIVSIGALVIFFLSLQETWYQPDVAMLAIIFAGACLGFLIWNWHPAKIFLGEGGSLFTGFLLGSLAIVSGGKIAITLLVLVVPILDVVRVIIRRVQNHTPVYKGDNEHLHYRLLQSGLSQRQAVLLFYAISLLCGVLALFLQSHQKMIALLFAVLMMLLVGLYFSKKD